jgi:LmbE family N-acetylglucosaminyl deacetylase
MKILAIGAHFDDVELGCGGTLLKHRDRGDDISILVVTHSGYSSITKGLERHREQARTEGENSAEFLKASLICMNKEPLILSPNELFVLEVEDIINKHKPDRVYTHPPYDCHADHAAVGYISMRACRKCDEVLFYRSNWYIVDNTDNDSYYINISDYIDKKIQLLNIFQSEIQNAKYSWIDFVKKQNSAAGAKVNVAYAETFNVMKMFWR